MHPFPHLQNKLLASGTAVKFAVHKQYRLHFVTKRLRHLAHCNSKQSHYKTVPSPPHSPSPHSVIVSTQEKQ